MAYIDMDFEKPKRGFSTTRSWREIWGLALTRPSLETYQDLLTDTNVSLSRAALWLYITYTINIALGALAQYIFGATSFTTSNAQQVEIGKEVYLIGAVCAPLWAVVGVLVWILILGVIHLVAKYMFGGTGNFDAMAFASAAFQAPMLIAYGVISIIPFVGLCLVLPMVVYSMFLGVISINAVHNIGWAQSLITYFALPIMLFGCACACIILIISLAASSTTSGMIFSLLAF